MKPRFFILSLLHFFIFSTAFAQGPNGTKTYYQAADGKSGEALKTALHDIISGKPFQVVSYDGLREAYMKTDVRADGYLRDWYSNITKFQPGSRFGSYKKEGDAYNREHSMPQSWFNEAKPMVSDIVHVIPTDGYINNMRSSDPFGEVNTSKTYKSSANNYSKSGSCRTPGYTGTVFEPNDEIKGDIARIYFYMATCYEDRILNWTNGTASTVIGGTRYKPLKPWVMDMMMRWAKQDPIDDVETARNNAVQQVQGNRNPFVDYPGLEEYVWGEKADMPFSYDNYGSPMDIEHYVAMPQIEPQGGTYNDSVAVTLTCATTDAEICYTLDGSSPIGTNAKIYEAPIWIRNSCTLRAIARRGEDKSSETSASYTIKVTKPDEEQTADGIEIALNNTFFGVSWSGSRPANGVSTMSGKKNSVSVTYDMGEGRNMFCNGEQIRLYPGNTLTFDCTEPITVIQFTLGGTTTNELQTTVGTIDGTQWQGNSRQVVFTASGSSGHVKLAKATVATATTSGIDAISNDSGSAQQDDDTSHIYDLQGRIVGSLKPGIYIRQGRKIVIGRRW